MNKSEVFDLAIKTGNVFIWALLFIGFTKVQICEKHVFYFYQQSLSNTRVKLARQGFYERGSRNIPP